MTQTLEIFILLREELLKHASPVGYKIIEEHRDDAFGSHYVTLAKSKRALRLIWDGRDYIFVLETNEDIERNLFKGWLSQVNELVPRPPWNQAVIDKILKSIGDGIASLNF